MVRSALLIVALLLLAACAEKPNRAPSIGVAYAGPATLNIRKDNLSKSAVVATVKHGDRLEIIQHRRRVMKVRTQSGIEGWTDESLLLSPAEIDTLRAFEKEVKAMPSQGTGSTFDPLNVHTEPDRQSPSFIQLKENEKFDMIAHRLAPRTAQARKPLVAPPVKKAAAKKNARDSGKVGPPPTPAPPGPPKDWIELSKKPSGMEAAEDETRHQAKAPVEDWSLIRTAKGESGWVLTSKTYMSISDEVAQYAEGHRITSYFSLGDVQDGDKVRHNYVWTTISQSTQPYDFDSFRMFIWNLRRHRYETAYIERNLKGYFPVKVEQVPYGSSAKVRGGQATSNIYPGFSVCVEKKDGGRYRRSYAFITNVIRFAGEKTCDVAPIENPKIPVGALVASAEQAAGGSAGKSLYGRFKDRLGELRKRWFGR